MLIKNILISAALVSATFFVANVQASQQNTQKGWIIKTKHNPVEQSEEHIAKTRVRTQKHIYNVRFRCQVPAKSKNKPLIKLRIVGANHKGKGAPFSNIKFNEINHTYYVPTRIRIGKMKPENLNWKIVQKYRNAAEVNLTPKSTLSGNLSLGSFLTISKLFQATKNQNIMAISGFYQNRSIVIHFATQNQPNSFQKFLSSCPATNDALKASKIRSRVKKYLMEYKNQLETIKNVKNDKVDPTLNGKIIVRLTINQNGQAHNISTTSNPINNLIYNFNGPPFPKNLHLKNIMVRMVLFV